MEGLQSLLQKLFITHSYSELPALEEFCRIIDPHSPQGSVDPLELEKAVDTVRVEKRRLEIKRSQELKERQYAIL